MISVVFNNQQWTKAASFYLRMLVFVQEQGISPKMEFDSYDTDSTSYVVIYYRSIPIATGRYQQDDQTTLHPDRLCIRKDWRKKGIGRRVLLELEHRGKVNGCTLSRIHGEKQAVGFYKKMGYHVVSDEFIEDGVICLKLEKSLI